MKFKSIAISLLLLTTLYVFGGCTHISGIKISSNTPDHKKSLPQGLSVKNGTTYITTHFFDKESKIYTLDSQKKVISSYQLPKEATHTSGICFNEEQIITVDYNTNKVYFFRKHEKKLHLIKSIPTNLKGTSSCDTFKYKDKKNIVITDFSNTKSSFILDLEILYETEDFEKSILAKYKNNGFSQGVFFYNDLIFDVGNSLIGLSKIEVRRLIDILEKKNKVLSFYTPIIGIQEIYIENDVVYTSDEVLKRFVSFNIDLDKIIETLEKR